MHRLIPLALLLCAGPALADIAPEPEPEGIMGGIVGGELPDEIPSVAEIQAFLEAEGSSPEEAAPLAQRIHDNIVLDASLDRQHGDISLAGGKATLHVPEEFAYIPASDSNRVLVAWGNPPGGGGLGMLIPMAVGPMDPEGWGAIITFEDDGHIDDEDAAEIDYDDMLKSMKEATEDNNKDLKSQGYEPIHIEGWAESPHYDAASKKLYWAKILRADSGGRSLNYDIRVLGRSGLLAISAVAPVEMMESIKVDMEQVVAMAEFNDGHRYADFDPDTDKMAAYGVGALVAGGLAAKTGLFKGLFALLLAGKKLVVVGLAALAAAVKGIFSGGKIKKED